MAGKRHHIIPRFLQKGFASRIEDSTKNEKVFVIQYLRGKDAGREESTRNTMASEHYYGKGEASADDEMTDFENEFLTPRIQALRDGASISPREIAELVAHFSIRPKLIRETFASMSKQFLGEMGDVMADTSLWNQAFENMPPEFVADLFQDLPSKIDADSEEGHMLKKLEASGFDLGKLGEMAASLTNLMMEDSDSRAAMSSITSSTLSEALTIEDVTLKASIKEGHVRSIKDQVVPERRVELFEQFTWEVQNCDFNLILGDCGVFYISRKEEQIVPFCDLGDVLAVFLPLSSGLLLRGFLPPIERMDEFKVGVNAEIAKCSYDEFVACSEKEEFAQLIPLIRSHDTASSGASELKETIEELRRNILDGTVFDIHAKDSDKSSGDSK
ncbi:MAG: hypothetical protein ACKVQJ_00550 [Pyrinomonadaceae bacterium]